MRYYELDSTETVIVAWERSPVGYQVRRKTRMRDLRHEVDFILDEIDFRTSVFEEEKQTPPNADDD